MSKHHKSGDKTHRDDAATTEKAGGRVATAYETMRERAENTAQSTASEIEANPMAALLGGLAIGAIAGALLPRSRKERELLQPVGDRIGKAARAAIDAGRVAGTEALEEAGLSGNNLRSQSAKMFEQAVKVAGAAGTAAASAARDTARR
jgi:hypothetical protein